MNPDSMNTRSVEPPSSAARPVRVLLADDQDLVRAGFRVILGAQPDIDVVGEAGNGAEAVTEVARLRPDVVLMDVQMPDVDGLTSTWRILDTPTAQHSVKVVILTVFDREDYLFEALKAGASGFLLKNAAPEELVDAVRIVARGDALLSPQVTRRVIARFTGSGPVVPVRRPEELTDREYEILVQVARGASNTEIAESLFLEQTTVKTHVSRILTKLDLRDRTQAVVFAYENGIVTPGSQ